MGTRRGTEWTAARVAALRQALGQTQEEFAHTLGVTVSTVNRWENGHIGPSRLAGRMLTAAAKRGR